MCLRYVNNSPADIGCLRLWLILEACGKRSTKSRLLLRLKSNFYMYVHMVFLLYARRRAVSCTAEHFCLHAAVYQCGFQNNKTKEPLVRMRLERGLSNIGAFLAAWLHSQIRSLCYLCVLRFFFSFFLPSSSLCSSICVSRSVCHSQADTHRADERRDRLPELTSYVTVCATKRFPASVNHSQVVLLAIVRCAPGIV